MVGAIAAVFLQVNSVLAEALVFPMLIDGCTQALGLRESRNSLRVVTGFCFSIGMGAAVIHFGSYIWKL